MYCFIEHDTYTECKVFIGKWVFSWLVSIDANNYEVWKWGLTKFWFVGYVWQSRVGFLHVRAEVSRRILFYLIGQRRRQAMSASNQNSLRKVQSQGPGWKGSLKLIVSLILNVCHWFFVDSNVNTINVNDKVMWARIHSVQYTCYFWCTFRNALQCLVVSI